jgi:hypothetical protein
MAESNVPIRIKPAHTTASNNISTTIRIRIIYMLTRSTITITTASTIHMGMSLRRPQRATPVPASDMHRPRLQTRREKSGNAPSAVQVLGLRRRRRLTMEYGVGKVHAVSRTPLIIVVISTTFRGRTPLRRPLAREMSVRLSWMPRQPRLSGMGTLECYLC